jgi:hypothetical protein
MAPEETETEPFAQLRPQIVSSLYLLSVGNGIVMGVLQSVATRGMWDALAAGFDVSIVVIAATIMGFSLNRRVPGGCVTALDWLVGGVYLALLSVPWGPASWTALTFLAFYEAVRKPRSPEAIAAACLFIGIAVTQLWGHLILYLFAAPLLEIDTTLVAHLLGLIGGGVVEHVGNLIANSEGHSLVIMTPCSSLSQISYGLLCWMTVVRAARPEWRWAEVPMALVVATSVIALNVLRMTLMGLSPEWYALFHGPIGGQIHSALVLLVAISAGWRAIPAAATPHAVAV